jgi:DNA-binding transcriptional LysR family regulator
MAISLVDEATLPHCYNLKNRNIKTNHPDYKDSYVTPSPSLDLDALRSYVLGLECGSFALAAQRLCRSTSAVSAQLKKLEQQCGTDLVMKQGRHLVPTASGERLLGYAKRLLALNDEAVLALKGELLQGRSGSGCRRTSANPCSPPCWGPSVVSTRPCMTTRIDRNGAWCRDQEGTLDMALAWQPQGEREDLPSSRWCNWPGLPHPEWDPAPLLARGSPCP